MDTITGLLSSSTIDSAIALTDVLSTIFFAFIVGAAICITYMKTAEGAPVSAGFAYTIIMLPILIGIIILLVGSNVARAFSLAGAFSIIRFRSAPGDPKDISYILFSLAAGFACGVGFYQYALLFTFIICVLLFILAKTHFGHSKKTPLLLKILIPEDLDYQGTFDEILKKYTNFYKLNKVRTTDLGALYELYYSVVLTDGTNHKEMIDSLRCRNGNLNITLVLSPEND